MTSAATDQRPLPAGAGEFWFLGTKMTMRASGASTGGALGLIEQVAPAGFAAPPHVHHGEDEGFYVVAGSLTFHCGASVIAAGPGAFVWLPRDQPHWFEVDAAGPATLLQLNTPAGLERFFAEMGTPVQDSAIAPAGEPDIGRLVSLAASYQVELLPPTAH